MQDLTYRGTNTMIYSLVEPAAYFICSCLPGIRPLLVAVLKKLGFNRVTGKYCGSLSTWKSQRQRHYELSGFSNSENGRFVSVSDKEWGQSER